MYKKHPRSQCGWSRESEGKVAKMLFRGITDQQASVGTLAFVMNEPGMGGAGGRGGVGVAWQGF